jgi:hypothetical protein
VACCFEVRIDIMDFGSHSGCIHFFGDAAKALENEAVGNDEEGLLYLAVRGGGLNFHPRIGLGLKLV